MTPLKGSNEGVRPSVLKVLFLLGLADRRRE
jgi:hypothetical protein